MEEITNGYQTRCNTTSDINEHLPTLYRYATECESIFETGVRGCVSSYAFAYGLMCNNSPNKRLLLNDISDCTNNVQELYDISKQLAINIDYIWKNNLQLELNETFDMCFIDTWHIYGQLKRELEKFKDITNKYIIMHDTTVDEWKGESIRMGGNIHQESLASGIPEQEIGKGLWPAIEEFLQVNTDWVLHERFTNNNGLTVLKKI